ncbi:hypothetical protein ElyMa_000069600 [Elysia marginata]|uniref:Uncharacterized protein n=1 Tax=Elysia marginata TaxID=1093978 RepID=A0AAV4EHX5_9GAST|nr:hypothetical protein ElyMa_000069600 [Elysia marginata]
MGLYCVTGNSSPLFDNDNADDGDVDDDDDDDYNDDNDDDDADDDDDDDEDDVYDVDDDDYYEGKTLFVREEDLAHFFQKKVESRF